MKDWDKKWRKKGYLFDVNQQKKFREEVLEEKDHEEVITWLCGQISLFAGFIEYNGLNKTHLNKFFHRYSNFIWKEEKSKLSNLLETWMFEYRTKYPEMLKFLGK